MCVVQRINVHKISRLLSKYCKKSKTSELSFGRALIFLLLLSGDIEVNPGPPSCAPSIHFAQFNSQSIHPNNTVDKPTILKQFINDYKIDVLALSETWLSPDELSSTINSILPDGFSFIHIPRPTGRGGGVGFIYKSELKVLQFKMKTVPTFECILIKFVVKNTSFAFAQIYRPPSSSEAAFLSDFSGLLEILASFTSNVHISGDFNIHIDQPSNFYTVKLLDLIHSFNLHQLVSFPTHIHGHTLDLFICSNDSKLLSDCVPVSVGFSDHCAVLCRIATQDSHVRPMEYLKTLRNFKAFNAAKFCNDVQSSGLLAVTDVPLDLYLNVFNSTLGKILDNHAPFKSFNCKTRQNKSFFNNKLRSEKRIRSQLESKWRKNKTQVNYDIYKTQTIKYAKLLTTTKRNYFRNLIQSNISNPTKLWGTLNKVMTRKDPEIIPSTDTNSNLVIKFSDFFSNKIKLLSEKFPHISSLNTPIHCDPPSQPPVLSVFHDTCDDEVRKAILASSDATCELDLMPTKFLKECLPVLAKPITIIINKCFSEGKFPSIFKQALVTPLHKKHSLPKDELNSYRPISNLNFLSKVAERIILSRLQEHLLNCKSLSNFQSAYKSGFSTETALNCIQNDLLRSIDKKQVSALVLLDLSAAFDTIDHTILVDRLGSYFGMEGKVLQLLLSYLQDRFQITKIGEAKSEPKKLSTGVPQGSVLGPLLFSLYITPLSQILSLHGVKFHFYADDTQIYISFSSSDSQPSLARLSNVLNITKGWFSANKLALNTSKTEFLIIGNKQQCNKLPDDSKKLIFDGQIINRSEHARNLGVIFDSDLSYKQHISNLCRCSFLNLRMVSRIRNLLDMDTAEMLVCSLVTSRLDYCNSLFFGLPDSTLQKLQLVQNSIARLVVPGTKKFDHISPILKYLHWLPIKKRIDFKIAVLTYKTIATKSPEYLYQHLNLVPDSSRRSSGKKLLSVPRIDSENGRRSFAYAAVSIWNSLPVTLRLNPSLDSFKKDLKTFLFPW